MARNRMIKVDFWADQKIGKISPRAKLLFIGIWNFCDDIGVCRANAGYLRSQIFQFDDLSLKNISDLLVELSSNDLVRLVEYNGESFLMVKNFLKHQKIDRPSKNRFIQIEDDKTLELFDSSSVHRGLDDDSMMNIKEKVKVKVKEKESEPEGSSSDEGNKEKITFSELLEIWNHAASQINIKSCTPGTKMAQAIEKRALEAFKDYKSVEDWERIVEAVAYNPFLSGANERHWRASLEWLFQVSPSKRIKNYILLMAEWDERNKSQKQEF